MIRLRRRPFAELVERQLDLFADECSDLISECEAALRAYDAVPSDEAEQRYGEVVDLVDTGRDRLEEIREAYARELDDTAGETYRTAFNERARKRFPRFGFELD